MKAQLRSMPQDKINALGKTKIGSGGTAVTCRVVRFVDNKGSAEYDTFSGADSLIELLPVRTETMPDKHNTVQTSEETGRKEVRCNVKYQDKAEQYIRYHIKDALEGKYNGSFAPILEYWDVEKNALADHVWMALDDVIWFGKVWRGATPDPTEVTSGTEITMNATFEQYISVPKAKGFGAAQEKVPAAPTAPTAPVQDEDAALVAAADAAEEEHSRSHRRAPTIRYTMSTNSGFQLSENNVRASPLKLWTVDNKKHFLRMPTWDGDNYPLVLPLSNYQGDLMTYDDAEPGPSTVRMMQLSLQQKDYQKVPRGQDAESTLREPKKTLLMSVLQYSGERPDVDVERPFSVETNAYTNHIHRLGITHLSTWLKFGRIPWQGVAVCTVNATDTLRLAINAGNSAAQLGVAGKIDCWVKTVHWDIESTLQKYAVPVPAALMARLYADIYVEAKKNNGSTFISCNMAVIEKTRCSGLENTLNERGDGRIYNLNEYRGEAGHIISEYQLYAVPYFPTPMRLVEDVAGAEDYFDDALAKLRQLGSDDDDLIAVLLGEKKLDGVDTYTDEEMDALKKLGNDEDRTRAWPGRGLAKTRVYKKGANGQPFKPQPSSLGFDFLVYAVQKDHQDEEEDDDDDDDEPVEEPKPKKKGKTHAKTRGQK